MTLRGVEGLNLPEKLAMNNTLKEKRWNLPVSKEVDSQIREHGEEETTKTIENSINGDHISTLRFGPSK